MLWPLCDRYFDFSQVPALRVLGKSKGAQVHALRVPGTERINQLSLNTTFPWLFLDMFIVLKEKKSYKLLKNINKQTYLA